MFWLLLGEEYYDKFTDAFCDFCELRVVGWRFDVTVLSSINGVISCVVNGLEGIGVCGCWLLGLISGSWGTKGYSLMINLHYFDYDRKHLVTPLPWRFYPMHKNDHQKVLSSVILHLGSSYHIPKLPKLFLIQSQLFWSLRSAQIPEGSHRLQRHPLNWHSARTTP